MGGGRRCRGAAVGSSAGRLSSPHAAAAVHVTPAVGTSRMLPAILRRRGSRGASTPALRHCRPGVSGRLQGPRRGRDRAAATIRRWARPPRGEHLATTGQVSPGRFAIVTGEVPLGRRTMFGLAGVPWSEPFGRGAIGSSAAPRPGGAGPLTRRSFTPVRAGHSPQRDHPVAQTRRAQRRGACLLPPARAVGPRRRIPGPPPDGPLVRSAQPRRQEPPAQRGHLAGDPVQLGAVLGA